MAYDSNDIRCVVVGNLAGGESWSNTWGFRFVGTSGADVQVDVVDNLRSFYTGWIVDWAPAETTAIGCTVTNLGAEVSFDADWLTVTGTNTNDTLPTQCAIRVSLTAGGTARGGPFLAGWSRQAADDVGLLVNTAQQDTLDALEALDTALIAAEWRLGIIRPTVEDVVLCTRGRVGQRFDVIRGRANQLAEDYFSTTLGA